MTARELHTPNSLFTRAERARGGMPRRRVGGPQRRRARRSCARPGTGLGGARRGVGAAPSWRGGATDPGTPPPADAGDPAGTGTRRARVGSAFSGGGTRPPQTSPNFPGARALPPPRPRPAPPLPIFPLCPPGRLSRRGRAGNSASNLGPRPTRAPASQPASQPGPGAAPPGGPEAYPGVPGAAGAGVGGAEGARLGCKCAVLCGGEERAGEGRGGRGAAVGAGRSCTFYSSLTIWRAFERRAWKSGSFVTALARLGGCSFASH